MDISFNTLLIWVVAIIILNLDIVIFLGSNKLSSKTFFVSIFWVFLWIFSVGVFCSIDNEKSALFFARLTYLLGTFIASSFMYFFFTFPDDIKPKRILLNSLVILQLCFIPIFLFSNLIISGVHADNSPSSWGWSFGIMSFIFELVFLGFFGYGTYLLNKRFLSEKRRTERKNLKFMLLTITIGAIPPIIACIILPRFNIFTYNWIGPVTEIIWIPIIAYSIIKYRQMDVKAIIAEVLVLSMTVIFFVNIFINVSAGIYLRIIVFLIFMILAYYLIRISIRESKQKDLLNDLNLHLTQKVAEQTEEVKKAFELEKKARRDLEKLNETKDQFIMITQHNLRTPVTSIRWELESILSGDKGELSAEIKKSLEDTKIATDRLARIVDDFLNITALKVGSQILNIGNGNIKDLLKGVIEDLKFEIKSLNINLEYNEKDYWPELRIDINKVREVLYIIIENAVRYNIRDGKIMIRTQKNENNFIMIVENTGVGFTQEDKGNIFKRLFYRGKKAQDKNPIGMGIGLTVARAIIRAHHGDLNISSEGENMGAKVELLLPEYFIDYSTY